MKPSPADPRSVFKLTRPSIFDVVALPGGTEVLCARNADSEDTIGTLERWDVTTGHRRGLFLGHTKTIRTVGLAFDNTRAVSASDDNTLRLWDLDRAACLQTFEMPLVTFAVTDDTRHAIIALDEHFTLFDLESGRRVRTFEGHRDRVMKVATIRGRGQCISASLDCSLRVWDLATGTCVQQLDANPKRRTFVSRLGEWNAESVTGVCVMPGSEQVVACYGDGTVRCWNLESGDVIADTRCGATWLTCVAVSPDGDQVLIGTWDRKVYGWRPGHDVLVDVGFHDGEVSTVAFLDDQRTISGSFDETLRVWDVASADCLRMIGTPRVSGLCPPNETVW